MCSEKRMKAILCLPLVGAILTVIDLQAALVTPVVSPLAVSPGAAADCHNPGISADGRFVVFVSAADNLVTNDNNGAFDVFVRDRQLGKTVPVSANIFPS